MEVQEPHGNPDSFDRPSRVTTATSIDPPVSHYMPDLKRGRGRPKKADPVERTMEKLITITFTDGSVYIAKNVISYGTTENILYFQEAKNKNKVTYVFARSIKTYEIEDEVNPT